MPVFKREQDFDPLLLSTEQLTRDRAEGNLGLARFSQRLNTIMGAS